MPGLVAEREVCNFQANPLEKAELYVTVAQAVQTLFCMYLRLHGVSPEEHPIAKEEVSVTARTNVLLQSSNYLELYRRVLVGSYLAFQKEGQQGPF